MLLRGKKQSHEAQTGCWATQSSGPETDAHVRYPAADAGMVEQSFNNKNYWPVPAIMCLTAVVVRGTSAAPVRSQERERPAPITLVQGPPDPDAAQPGCNSGQTHDNCVSDGGCRWLLSEMCACTACVCALCVSLELKGWSLVVLSSVLLGAGCIFLYLSTVTHTSASF